MKLHLNPGHSSLLGAINRRVKAIAMGAASLAAAQLGAVSAANAQSDVTGNAREGETVLEEIIVTARRRPELLRDVPVSMTVFSGAELEKNNIDDVSDYLMKTPNVSFVEGGIRGTRTISIRGVSNIGGQADAVAFYVDGFNIVNGPRGSSNANINSSVNPPLQDIESIVVLRGPQGTYFGRNATGGAISVTTKKPEPAFYAEGSAEYSNYSTWSIGSVVNAPLVANRLFARGSVFYEESDGFIENVNPIGGQSDRELLNVRGALRFAPSDRLLVDFSVNYTDDAQGIPATVGSGVLNRSSTNLLGGPAIDDGLGFYPENQTLVNHDYPEHNTNEFLTLIERIEWKTDRFTITNITGYFDSSYSFAKDHDKTSRGNLKFDTDVSSDSFSTELRISSNEDSPMAWVVGGIYARDDLHQLFAVVPGADGFLGLPENFKIDTGDRMFKNESYAIFAEATRNVTDRLALTVGGRYSYDEAFLRFDGIGFEMPDPTIGGTASFNDFSPKVAATFDISDEFTVYATVSRGYKAGGLQTGDDPLLDRTDYDQETVWNYESGIRYVADNGRLRANITGFYMDWSDMQVTTANFVVNPATGEVTTANSTDNAARASSQGIEFDIRAVPVEGLELGAAIGWLEAEFGTFENAIVEGQIKNLSGMPIPRAPEWTASADAHYTFFEDILGLQPYMRGEVSYRSESIPVIDSLGVQGFPNEAPSFSVWNFRLGASSDQYAIEAYAENAFDEEYFTTIGGTSFSGRQIRPAVRRYGVRFLAHFE